MRQAIICTSADPIHWCIYAALEGDELTLLVMNFIKHRSGHNEQWYRFSLPEVFQFHHQVLIKSLRTTPNVYAPGNVANFLRLNYQLRIVPCNGFTHVLRDFFVSEKSYHCPFCQWSHPAGCKYNCRHVTTALHIDVIRSSLTETDAGLTYQRFNSIQREKYLHIDRLSPIENRSDFLVVSQEIGLQSLQSSHCKEALF